MLHQFEPTTPPPPSGKWESTNDVYAYYLLDVEMSACQLTSRLVQASGSVQLFVQRCHMGLEPDVLVKADGDNGDSAWRCWKWMQKYRLWEANRKVFLYPENWIEPELRRDKSQFFKDLENELLQNEVNQYTVETAFQNYLEKLDGVAQLEIAGFYQEDDADHTILHVFGRTRGGEPHIYYYRQYDYRRWTAWEKVDLDIAGDYLIPAVVNKRLFLFWPVFTEVPDEAGNKAVSTPKAEQHGVPLPETKKIVKLQLAVSQHRQGKWTPKKISTDFAESDSYTGEIINSRYVFWAIDRSSIDGRFGIGYSGSSVAKLVRTERKAGLSGSFEVGSCKGVPELSDLPGLFVPALIPDQADQLEGSPLFLRWPELGRRTDFPENDFTLLNSSFDFLQSFGISNIKVVPREWSGYSTPILIQTPKIFKMSPPWHLSYLDSFWLDTFVIFNIVPSPTFNSSWRRISTMTKGAHSLFYRRSRGEHRTEKRHPWVPQQPVFTTQKSRKSFGSCRLFSKYRRKPW
jgi:hypothetical protein